MANSYAVGAVIEQDFAITSTVQLHEIGMRVKDQKGNVFRYFKGVASTVKGSLASIANTGAVTLVTTAGFPTGTGGLFVVACAAHVAGNFGWYLQEYTRDSDAQWGIRTGGAMTVGAQITTTAVAGEVDDAAGTKLLGIRTEVDPGSASLATGISWHEIHLLNA